MGVGVKSAGSGMLAERVIMSVSVGDTEVREEGKEVTEGEANAEVVVPEV